MQEIGNKAGATPTKGVETVQGQGTQSPEGVINDKKAYTHRPITKSPHMFKEIENPVNPI